MFGCGGVTPQPYAMVCHVRDRRMLAATLTHAGKISISMWIGRGAGQKCVRFGSFGIRGWSCGRECGRGSGCGRGFRADLHVRRWWFGRVGAVLDVWERRFGS